MAKNAVLHRLGTHSGPDDIEPSCGVIDIREGTEIKQRLVIDCGSGSRRHKGVETFFGPDLSLFEDGRPIDAVLVTHAHHDHVGCLPALVPYLSLDAQFIMTRPTALAVNQAFMLELRAASKAIAKTAPGVAKPYGLDDVRKMLSRVTEITSAGCHELLPGLQVWVQSAGHISGACSYTLLAGQTRVHYAGDRCDHDQPGILGARPLPPAWRPQIVAGSDCTYGYDSGGTVPAWRSEMDRAIEMCRKALDERRRVLFYAFSLHRAGAIAHELQRAGLTRGGRVFLDGSACGFADLYTSDDHIWCDRDEKLVIDRVNHIWERKQREAVLNSNRGYVVIAPPGMGGPGGVGTWWRRELLPDPGAVVAFSGFVAPDTDGQIILAAEAERQRTGNDQRVKFRETDRLGHIQSVSLDLACQVEHFRLGGHNDRQGTIKWFLDLAPETAILTHGSMNAIVSVEASLAGSGIKLIRSDLEPVTVIDL
ncbi:MAG: MBL fold metallo-hydrolase [Patescibacteria group bacterium]|jgi:Cft2 family RNA processing exonuclease